VTTEADYMVWNPPSKQIHIIGFRTFEYDIEDRKTLL